MTQSKALVVEHRIGKVSLEVLIVLLGSLFLALFSQLSIPLAFTPVPLTLQTLGVFILAGTLGSKRATYSVLAYLAQSCCGLPVLAGGLANPLWFLDLKAGFLVSFIAAAFLIGKMIEKRPHSNLLYLALSLVVGQLVISFIGMIWLSFYVGLYKAFMFGVVPFLSGAGLKIIAGALILKGYAMCRKTITPGSRYL